MALRRNSASLVRPHSCLCQHHWLNGASPSRSFIEYSARSSFDHCSRWKELPLRDLHSVQFHTVLRSLSYDRRFTQVYYPIHREAIRDCIADVHPAFFKDMARLDDIGKLAKQLPEVFEIFLNVLAGLVMFLLVTMFVHTARKSVRSEKGITASAELQVFIARKKAIALVLTVSLVSLAVYSLIAYLGDYSRVVYRGAAQRLDPNTVFYTELFTIMIFADVLILILSLALFDKYEFVFRNVAFVIATILIRFSLTSGPEYGPCLAIGGMLFGLFTLLIYNYNLRVQAIQQA